MRNPDPRIKPPLGSYIDWSHPLAEGLEVCLLFNEGTGKPYDLKRQSLCTGNISWSGASLDFDGTNNQVLLARGNDWPTRSISPGSIFAICYPEDITSVPICSVGEYDNNNTTWGLSIWSDSKLTFDVNGLNSYTNAQEFSVVVESKKASFGVSMRDASTRSYLYDGKIYGPESVVNIINYPVNANNPYGIGVCYKAGGVNGRFKGSIELVYEWSSPIGEDALLLLSSEPYSFILWPSQTSIFDLGAGGGTSLTCDNIAHSQSIANPALTQLQALLTGNMLQSQEIDALSLSQLHNIDPGNVAQSQAVSLINLLQNSTVTVSSANQAQSIESPSLAQIAELITSSINQAQSVDSIEITIQGGLSIYSIGQTQTVNSLGLAQVISLVTNTVSQAQSVDSLTITLTGGLSIDSLTQDQSIGALTLAQVIALTVNQIAQAQNIDQVNLATNFVLDINGVTTSQTLSGPVTLSQISEILTSDLLQGQTITSISFSGVKGVVTVTFKAKVPRVEFKPKGSSMSFN